MPDKSVSDVETEWSNELGEVVSLREFPEWGQVDIYVGGKCLETVINLEVAEARLAYYYMTRDFAIGQGR